MTLARRGVSTVLLDKKVFPRDKPCGGGIRHGVRRRFPELMRHLEQRVPIHEISKVMMEAPSGASVLATLEEPLYLTFRRIDFDAIYVAYGYKGWPGYGYVFPKRCCVDAGVGFLLPFFKETLGGAPYEHHARFLQEMSAKGVVRGSSNPDNFKAYRLPLCGPLARTAADRAVVCGDAGGFVNAYTGEGIFYAMVTGEHAGLTLAEALKDGDLSAGRLSAYEARWQREI